MGEGVNHPEKPPHQPQLINKALPCPRVSPDGRAKLRLSLVRGSTGRERLGGSLAIPIPTGFCTASFIRGEFACSSVANSTPCDSWAALRLNSELLVDHNQKHQRLGLARIPDLMRNVRAVAGRIRPIQLRRLVVRNHHHPALLHREKFASSLEVRSRPQGATRIQQHLVELHILLQMQR